MKRISGTREWAVASANCALGCSHNCRYCYAKAKACDKGLTSHDGWINKVVDAQALENPQKKVDGYVMFPTQHDICPDILEPCLEMIDKILSVGNDILIVSKPHLSCIKEICRRFESYRRNILFRFTMGAMNNDILRYWEPGAPTFEERLESLKWAYDHEFKTSVSCEPMLDPRNIRFLFGMVEPFVTDSIWLGKLNQPEKRVQISNEEDQEMLGKLISSQSDACIKTIYERLKGERKIRWKESIKEVVGLPPAPEAGMNI